MVVAALSARFLISLLLQVARELTRTGVTVSGRRLMMKVVALVQIFALSGCGTLPWGVRADPTKRSDAHRMTSSPEISTRREPSVTPVPRPPDATEAAGTPPVAQAVPERPSVPPPPAIPTERAAAKGDYVLGEDDEVEISVYGNPDLSKTQVVRPGGFIAFPLVGSVKASDLTPEELRAQIANKISRYVKDPQVTVIVKAYNSRKISVLGEVKTPGLLRLSTDITLLEALSRAGGINEDADLVGSRVLRGHQLVATDFVKLLKQGDAGQNIPIQPGDVILVPNVKDKKVFVLGQVTRPLVLALTPGLSLIESVSRAGGLTEDADLDGALVLRDGRPLPVSFDKLVRLGDATQNVLLQTNDTILVPNIKNKKIYVLGEVRNPLVAPLKPGTTVIESVSMAGGFTRKEAI